MQNPILNIALIFFLVAVGCLILYFVFRQGMLLNQYFQTRKKFDQRLYTAFDQFLFDKHQIEAEKRDLESKLLSYLSKLEGGMDFELLDYLTELRKLKGMSKPPIQ